MQDNYFLLDSGDEKKVERFGDFTLVRPCSQAVWPMRKKELLAKADATFSREGKNEWVFKRCLPSFWEGQMEGVKLKLSLTEFGHVGLFPEHRELWKYASSKLTAKHSLLNLFAYSGAATLAAAKKGCRVCHLDASKPMVDWARENARLNHLEGASIRWIVDDVFKFLKREVKRGVTYDAIILDPPSFGRGNKQEVFKIERDIINLLLLCKELLSKEHLFVIFSAHTPGFTPQVMQNLMQGLFGPKIEAGELTLKGENTFLLPSGSYAIYEKS
jgi:23S rRNA (cytosine1962-C5)-methyltransferase